MVLVNPILSWIFRAQPVYFNVVTNGFDSNSYKNPDLVNGGKVIEVALGPGEDASVVHVDVTHLTVEPEAN